MVQTTRYRLVKREGDRLHLTVSSTEAAPPGEIEDLDVKISTFVATGEGTSIVDLAGPFPVTSSYRLTTKVSGEREGKPVAIAVEVTTEVRKR
jgi:hypothetical protein